MLNPIVLKNLHNKVNWLNIKLLYFLRGLLTKFTVSGLQLLNKKKAIKPQRVKFMCYQGLSKHTKQQI